MCYSWIPPIVHKVSETLFAFVLICITATVVCPQKGTCQGIEETAAVSNSFEPGAISILPVRTDSPRETFKTFLRLTRELESVLLTGGETPNRENADRVQLLSTQFRQLLDLSSVPKASRLKVGKEVGTFLLDIIGRIDPVPIESVPDATAFYEDETIEKWRIPGTPLSIARIKEGPDKGEFLFDARTLTLAETFYHQIQHLPLRSSLEIKSWSQIIPQLHGPMIPLWLVSALPNSLKHTWLDTAVWKIILAVIIGVLVIFLLFLWHRVINWKTPEGSLATRFHRLLLPLAIILFVIPLESFFSHELNVFGTFAQIVDFVTTLVNYFAAVWIFWILVRLIFEWVILSPKIPDQSLDANLLRLSARIIGFVGGVLILAKGIQEVGLPVFGLLAGLGFGGIGVALAIRPTLENLMGGLVLYADRPVRIGDYCSFGTHTGTVESIGVRSTKIRATDRTLISIPNATFANMEIINWAQCDMMLILTVVGLRYETDPDQLRYVLAKMREMFHAHPKIDRDTIRIRFVGYGESSLDIEIRVYALTREWNSFFAIREDVLLRVKEIVNESGTDFAFPSQTVYMGRDDGLDKERSKAAAEEVESWRRSGRLPFPRLSASKMEELSGTLDYPPYGSPDLKTSTPQREDAPEPLSAEPLSKKPQTEDNGEKEKKPESNHR